jgi:hypothetical protein
MMIVGLLIRLVIVLVLFFAASWAIHRYMRPSRDRKAAPVSEPLVIDEDYDDVAAPAAPATATATVPDADADADADAKGPTAEADTTTPLLKTDEETQETQETQGTTDTT